MNWTWSEIEMKRSQSLSTEVNKGRFVFKFAMISKDILDNLVPFKYIRIRQKLEQWLTKEILDKINIRDKLLRKFIKSIKKNMYSQFSQVRKKFKEMPKMQRQII